MSNEQIQQLQYALQEQQALYKQLYTMAKNLIDAGADYKRHQNAPEKLKQQKFTILKKREQQLKELIYPQTKPSSQAKLNWLAQ